MSQETVLACLKRLNYDFKHFNLNDFIEHIQGIRRRDILLIAWSFDHDLSALWIRAETADYVFYNAEHHVIHQTHGILHELGHIVLAHHCHPIKEVLPANLLAQLKLAEPQGHTRMAAPRFLNSSDEEDAEAFAYEIQRYVVHTQRLQGLIGQGSSIAVLNDYVAGLAFDG